MAGGLLLVKDGLRRTYVCTVTEAPIADCAFALPSQGISDGDDVTDDAWSIDIWQNVFSRVEFTFLGDELAKALQKVSAYGLELEH